MNAVVVKGNGFSGKYTHASIPSAVDWIGSVGVYRTYPGGAELISVQLSVSQAGDELIFSIPAEDIMALDTGLYSLVGSIVSSSLGIDSSSLDYMTVTSQSVSSEPLTTISMTILKVDGTPAGKETRTLTNTVDGAMVTLGWNGVEVTASNPVADAVSGAIIGTETVSTKTDASGYAQLVVIKGQTVTVSCPSFGKSVTVDTTGLDTVDLSTQF